MAARLAIKLLEAVEGRWSSFWTAYARLFPTPHAMALPFLLPQGPQSLSLSVCVCVCACACVPVCALGGPPGFCHWSPGPPTLQQELHHPDVAAAAAAQQERLRAGRLPGPVRRPPRAMLEQTDS